MKSVGMMSFVISSLLVMGGCGSTYQYRAATPAGHNCQMHCFWRQDPLIMLCLALRLVYE